MSLVTLTITGQPEAPSAHMLHADEHGFTVEIIGHCLYTRLSAAVTQARFWKARGRHAMVQYAPSDTSGTRTVREQDWADWE